jgi:hypothetical protein
MNNILAKQSEHLKELEKLSRQDRIVQLASTSIQRKTDIDEDKHSQETNDNLKDINKTLKENLGDKGKLTSNVIKLADYIKKNIAPLKVQEKTKPKQLGLNADQIKSITEQAMGRKVYRGVGERVEGVKDQVKDFFSARGFLDKTGIVKRGTGGIFSDMLDRREEKQKYIKSRKETQGNTFGSEETYARQFDEQQNTQRKIRKNESVIKGYQELGFKDTQIKRSDAFKEQGVLAEELAASDTRVRPAKEAAAKEGVAVKSNTKKLGIEADTSEKEIENARMMTEQTELLRSIEENTRDKSLAATEKRAQEGSGGGFLGGIMGMLGKSLMTAFKALFNPAVLLKFLTKFLAPAMLIGGIVNGIMDGWNAFIEGGSFSDVIIAGLGGVLEFLSFGLFDANTIKKIVGAVSGFIDEYVIEPIKKFIGFLGESFDKYIKEPILGAFEYIGNLFTEYIINPVKEFFAPIADFFAKIKEQVFGFLEDFGIPEIGFTIPVINKKVSIGPFYPFRPEQGTNRVASNSDLSQSSSAGGEKSDFKQNIVTSGKTAYSNKDGSVRYGKDETNVLSTGEKVVDGKATYTSNMATFDPKTGKSTISGDAGERDISKRAFNKIKSNAKEGGDNDKVAEILKEDDAYQKLGFLDKRKVDLGLAKATDLATVEPSKAGGAVYTKSADNAGAAQKPSSGSVNTVVAPTTNVNNNTTQITKMPTRNTDPSLTNYVNSRYAY